VYNGARHLRHALDSILTQSFENLEVIICDNASTDATPDICCGYAARDTRVKYFRSDKNRGLARNFNWAFTLAKGQYVVWIGHDDIMAKDFLGQCVLRLEEKSTAVLCFTGANYIDDTGNEITPINLRNPGAGETPSARFSELLYDDRCDPICGLMRRDALQETHLHGAYADSDRVLLTELAFQGHFEFISERLYFRRMHEQQTTTMFRDRRERTLVFDPTKAGKRVFPWTREMVDLALAVLTAPVRWKEKCRSLRYLYWWVCCHRRFILHELYTEVTKIKSARPKIAAQ
jgi:glycosyltransferase involved in cell wall biosynthesis